MACPTRPPWKAGRPARLRSPASRAAVVTASSRAAAIFESTSECRLRCVCGQGAGVCLGGPCSPEMEASRLASSLTPRRALATLVSTSSGQVPDRSRPASLSDRSRPAGLASKPKPPSRPRFKTEAAQPASRPSFPTKAAQPALLSGREKHRCCLCFQGHPRTVSRGDTYLRKLVRTAAGIEPRAE